MKIPATIQKLRGGYYTPLPIARFLAEWAIQSSSDCVLEPSCGDGNLLVSAVHALLRRGATLDQIGNLVTGIELDTQEGRKAVMRLEQLGIPTPTVHSGDFFAYCREQLMFGSRFDAIIGNPPFIRYQHFDEAQRVVAFQIMEQAGLRPTRLTNTWVPFLVASTLLFMMYPRNRTENDTGLR